MHGLKNLKNRFTYFGRSFCPSSGVSKTVHTATGICHTGSFTTC